jgi:hypothetical protein
MVQTVVLILLLLGGVMIAQANLDVLHAQLRVALPGLSGVPLTLLRALTAVAAAFVALWIAGLIDLAIARRRIRGKETALRSMERAMTELKSTEFDRQRSTLTTIERRLDVLAQEVRSTITRREAETLVESQRPIRPDLTPGAVRTVREHVTVTRTRDNSLDEDDRANARP